VTGRRDAWGMPRKETTLRMQRPMKHHIGRNIKLSAAMHISQFRADR
jgi:hypothetical protein